MCVLATRFSPRHSRRNPPRPVAIFIGVVDLLMGAAAAVIAFVADEAILYAGLAPLAFVLVPIGVLEILRAIRRTP